MKKSMHIIINLLVVILATQVVSGCGGAEQRKAKYLAKGKAFIEEQNYEKAKVELKNVLQIDPKQAEAYYLVGYIEEKKQNWPQAFGNYSKAVELNPEYIDARAKLGRLYLLSGNLDKAVEMTEYILTKQPNHIVGKTLKVAIMAKKGDVKAAMQKAEELVAENPSSADAIDLLAFLYLKQENRAKAAEILEKGIIANPKNISFHATLAQLYVEKNEPEKAAKLMQDIIRLEPKVLQHRVALAAFYARLNQVDKAEKTLRDAILEDPKDGDRYLLLADLLASRKGRSEAESELLTAIKNNPKIYKIRFGLAKLYEQAGELEKAATMFRDVIEADGKSPDGLRARDSLALLLLKQGRMDEPEKLIDEVLKENPQDNDALVMQGKLALIKGKPVDAIASFRSALRDQPSSIEILSLLADAHMANKAPELAKENLFKIVELNPGNAKGRIPLAQFYAKTGDYGSALKKIDEALKLSPNDLDALQVKTEILAAKRDMKGVYTVLTKIKETYPDKSIGYYQMGQYYAALKKYDEALREFDEALKRSADNLQALSSIISVYSAQGKPALAVERLKGILKDKPNHPFAHEILAEIFISQKQFSDAEKELQESIKVNPKWNVPYQNLAGLYLMQNQVQAAEESYRQGLSAIPEDPQLLLQQASFYEKTRNFAKAISSYERILQKNPSFDVAANNLASLLTDWKGDTESLKQAKTLAIRFESSSQPAFRDTLGWVYYKSGETEKAFSLFQDVVKQAPTIAVFRYHLGMAYYKKGDNASAKTELSKALEAKNDFPGIEEAKTTLKKIQ